MGTCTENRKRLNTYIDGELTGPARREIEAHLSVCRACRRELNQMRGLERLLSRDVVPPVPEGLSGWILAEAARLQDSGSVAAIEWRDSKTYPIRPWWIRGATAAVFVLGLAIGTWMGWTSTKGLGARNHTRTRSAQDQIGQYLIAFEALGAAPQGSIEGATLELLGGGR